MQPAPQGDFDVPHWCSPKVHPDHHVQVLKALYSVPTRYIGKVVEARADRKTVRLYLGAELIKLHARKAAGQRSTDPKDFPPGKAAWALRDVDSVLGRRLNLAELVVEMKIFPFISAHLVKRQHVDPFTVAQAGNKVRHSHDVLCAIRPTGNEYISQPHRTPHIGKPIGKLERWFDFLAC